MKKKASELEFISQIKRDGSGVTKIKESFTKVMEGNNLMLNDVFEINCLSISEKTFIASGFNSFVVKLKDIEKDVDAIKFLRDKNIVNQDKTDLTITFEDGRKQSLVALLTDFGKSLDHQK